MHDARAGILSMTLLSLLPWTATAQTAPKRITLKPAPRLHVIARTTPELVVLDLANNGIDLSGSVRTALVTGSMSSMRWVRPQSDDALLLIDATALRASGFALHSASGEAIEGSVFPRAGVKLTDPSGSASTAATALDLLARLDHNRDGRLDASDPGWTATSLFRDRDGDGAIAPGELTSAAEILQSLSITASGAESTDAFGTRRTPGAGQLRDGTTVAVAHAKPAAME